MANIVQFQDDMNEEDKKSLQQYIKNGCPGLVKTSESDIFKWFQLYLSGKTYTEIAKITLARRDVVLYMSYKQKWMDKRMEHYSDIADNFAEKLKQTKLTSANTIATIIMALGKYYGGKFDKYLAQKDDKIVESIDVKMLAQYYKSMEALDKIIGDSVKKGKKGEKDKLPRNPLVNINMAGGQIRQIDENTIEITDENAGDFLKALAGAKKSKDDEKK